MPGRCSVVPDRFGFPTDMGCIGPVEVRTATFSLHPANRRSTGRYSAPTGRAVAIAGVNVGRIAEDDHLP